MKPSLSPAPVFRPTIEPLEARIAPAGILLVGETGATQDTEYNEAPFMSLAAPAPNAPVDVIRDAVGVAPNTYYIILGTASGLFNRIDVSDGGSFEQFLTITSGKAVAFFHDQNGDLEVQRGELKGLALGPNTVIDLNGSLDGDVVTNFDVATNTVNMTSAIAGQGITNFDANTVNGKILSGGQISKATFSVGVNALFTGSATNGQTFDFIPTAANGTGTLSFAPAVGKAGPSILNLTTKTIVSATAGDGGAGALGGSLQNFRISEDNDGMTLNAGNGGNADLAAGKPNGGAGGFVKEIYIAGTTDASPQTITMNAGDGGDSTTGTGGKGGVANNLFVGFRKTGPGAPVQSREPLADNVFISAGDGGDGKIGGAGAAATTIRVTVKTDNNLLGNELAVAAGDGGAAVGSDAVRGGVGGLIKDVVIRNLANQDNALNAVNAGLLLDAGDGGVVPMTSTTALGAAGGSIINSKLLGSELTALAGDGSAGKNGGKGGDLVNLDILQDGGVSARIGVFDAGGGGNSGTGSAGRGGNITGMNVNGDFSSLRINGGMIAGDGGDSATGRGGAGGTVLGLQFVDLDSRILPTFPKLNGAFVLNTGDGGDGSVAGNGGLLLNALLLSENLTHTVTTGNGGNNTVKGNGGAGGKITTLNLQAAANYFDGLNTVPVFATVTSGAGGNGGTAAGNVSSGGAGGAIVSAAMNAAGSGTLIGGNGGNGGNGAAGRGASITLSGVFAGSGDTLGDLIQDSDALMQAGDAGALGAKPGVGGSISGASIVKPSALFATRNISVLAGDGTHGGAGGSIKNVGYGSSGFDPVVVNNVRFQALNGNVLIQSGAGSVDATGKFLGAGGTISFLTGTVTTGPGTATIIRAGDGGGNAAGSSAGGSILKVNIEGGPAETDDFGNPLPFLQEAGTLIIEAGDAGNSSVASSLVTNAKGAKGGAVDDLIVSGIGATTTFRSIAGGDGGAGSLTGGLGGSVKNVRVLDQTIGVMSGQVYGYNTMGGIFAGLGGDGATDGLAGNVQFVSADSISAIVAGKAAAPGLVEQVNNVSVNAGPPLLPALATSINTEFVLTFHPIMQVVTNVEGGGALPEQQTITRLLGGTGSTNQPPGGPTTFTLEYGGERTGVLDANATTGEIAAALNMLSTIPAPVTVANVPGNQFRVTFPAGVNAEQLEGVGEQRTAVLNGRSLPSDVATQLNRLPNIFDNNPATPEFNGVQVASGPTSVFQVTFNSLQDQGEITGERAFDAVTEITTLGTNTDRQVEIIDVLGVGEFQLSVGGQSTPRLPANAPAQQVENALNGLTNITSVDAGPVTVERGINSSYIVTFQDPGTAPTIVGREFTPLVSNTTTPGSGTAQEVQSINFPGLRPANAAGPENVDGLVFVIPNNGIVTVPGDATAQEVQDALNTVLDDGATTPGLNGVTVTLSANNTYSITFNNPAEELPITAFQRLPVVVTEPVAGSSFTSVDTVPGDGSSSEVQHLDVGQTATPFSLTFGGSTTSVASADPTAQEVQDALNSLAPIQAEGNVTVTGDATNGYDITFGNTDPQGQITGGFPESQRIDVNNVGAFTVAFGPEFLATPTVPGDATTQEVQHFDPGTTLAPFNVSFNGQTATVPANATAQQVQDGLNSLSAVQAAGGVTATGNADTGYDVTFNTAGNRNNIYGSSAAVTTLLQPNASAAQVQATLNAVAAANGFPAVSVTGGPNGVYNVAFQGNGNQVPLYVTETVPLFTPAPPPNLPAETVQLTIPQLRTFDPIEYAQARIVGAIADFNELGANIFKFIDADNDGLYDFANGEIPIDGLIAAKKFSQVAPTNFTPQARYVLATQTVPKGPYNPLPPGSEFFDFTNL